MCHSYICSLESGKKKKIRAARGFKAGQDAVNRTCIFVNQIIVAWALPGKLSLAGLSGKGRDQILAFPASQWPASGPSDAPATLESGSGNRNTVLQNHSSCGQQSHTASRGTAGTARTPEQPQNQCPLLMSVGREEPPEVL